MITLESFILSITIGSQILHVQDSVMWEIMLGDPGTTSRDDAIFLGDSLLQELKSPWELILTEPVPEVVEFRPTDWAVHAPFLAVAPNQNATLQFVLCTIDSQC